MKSIYRKEKNRFIERYYRCIEFYLIDILNLKLMMYRNLNYRFIEVKTIDISNLGSMFQILSHRYIDLIEVNVSIIRLSICQT